MNSRPELKLDWCSHAAAKFAVEHWHYSRQLPKSSQQFVGVWESGKFIGCVIFGKSISPHLGAAFKLDQWTCVELTRVALTEHNTPVSKIVSIAMRMVRRLNPNLRLFVSFADPSHCHYGGIYQAMGWIYVGKQINSPREVLFRGKWRNDTRVFKLLVGKDKSAFKWRRRESKHKYLMPLDAEMWKRIEPLRKPYPKRAVSDTMDTAGHQPAKGGSTPTTALQSVLS